MNAKDIFLTGGIAAATFTLGYFLGTSSNVNLNASLDVSSPNSQTLEKKLINAEDNKKPKTKDTKTLDYPTTVEVFMIPKTEQPISQAPTSPSTVVGTYQPNTDRLAQPAELPKAPGSEPNLEDKLRAEEAKRVAEGFLGAIDYPIKLFSDEDMLKPEIRDHVQNVRYNKDGFIRSRSFTSGPVRELSEEYSAPVTDPEAIITIEDKNDSQPAYIRFICKNGLKILLDDPYYLDLFGKTFKDGDEVELMYRTVIEHWNHTEAQCEYKSREWLRKRWIITKEGKPTDKFYPVLVNVRAKKK